MTLERFIPYAWRPAIEGGYVAHIDHVAGYADTQRPVGVTSYGARRKLFSEKVAFRFTKNNVVVGNRTEPRFQTIPLSGAGAKAKIPAGDVTMQVVAHRRSSQPDGGGGEGSRVLTTEILRRLKPAAEGDVSGPGINAIHLVSSWYFDIGMLANGMDRASLNDSGCTVYIGRTVDDEILLSVSLSPSVASDVIAGGKFEQSAATMTMEADPLQIHYWEAIGFAEGRSSAGYESDPINMRLTGADPTGKIDATPYFNQLRESGRPIIIDGDYRMEQASYVDPSSPGGGGLHLIGRGGRILGWDGHGFAINGGRVHLEGDLTFEGFEDPVAKVTVDDWQRNNMGATVMGIEPSFLDGAPDRALVDSIYVGPGVKVLNCRSFIRASGTRIPNQVERMVINGLQTDGCPTGIIMTGSALRSATITNSVFRNGIGGGSDVGAIYIGPDDLPIANTANARNEYRKYGGFIVNNNFIDTFVQKTTTGDSRPGNTYPATGILCNGWGVVISDNVVRHITGVNYDCEGIYTKSVAGIVSGNSLYNAGSWEGAIALKGYDVQYSDDAAVHGKGLGDTSMAVNNVIWFSDHTWHHADSNITVDLTRSGIALNAGNNIVAQGNLIRGANVNAIRADEDDSSYPDQEDLIISQNRIVEFEGKNAIAFTSGRYTRCNISDNEIEVASDNDNDVLSGIYLSRLIKGFRDSNLKRNTLSLLNQQKNTIAACTNMDVRVWSNFENIQFEDNIVNGEGQYRAYTHWFSLATTGDPYWLARRSGIVMGGMVNNYRPTGGGTNFLFGGDRGAFPADFVGGGRLVGEGATQSSPVVLLEVTLRSPQQLYININYNARRSDPPAAGPVVARGNYYVSLARTSGDANDIHMQETASKASSDTATHPVYLETTVEQRTNPNSGNQFHVAVLRFHVKVNGIWRITGFMEV